MVMSPRSGETNPAIIRRSVVFPQPLGPRKVKKSPLRTCRLTPFTTGWPSKALDTLWS